MDSDGQEYHTPKLEAIQRYLLTPLAFFFSLREHTGITKSSGGSPSQSNVNLHNFQYCKAS